MDSHPHSYTELCALFGKDIELITQKSTEEICLYVRRWMCKHYRIVPYEINHGYCFIFAYLVEALNPRKMSYWSTDGHIALSDGSYFYDADHCFGTEDSTEIFGHRRTPLEYDRDTATMYWAHCGVKRVLFLKLVRKLEPTNALCFVKNLKTYDISFFQAECKVAIGNSIRDEVAA